MTTYYLEIRMTKPSGPYWTIGLEFEAVDWTAAVALFTAWSNGVKAVSSFTPYLCNLGDTAGHNRSYFSIDSSKEIFEEMDAFQKGPVDVKLPDTGNPDDCPF